MALVGPEVEENLGLRYLAAALGRQGFQSAVVPFNDPAALLSVRNQLLAASPPPLLVALSLSFQWRALDFLSLAIALREAGFSGHITAGGHFGTLCRRELLEDFPELDSLCRYEAEGPIVALAQALAQARPLHDVPGLATRRDGVVNDGPCPTQTDLASAAWPDRRGPEATCLGHTIAPLVGGRGCYASCSFCCIAAWHRENGGHRFRTRPIEDVADEMVWLQRERDADIFIFHDDNFFLPGADRSLARIHALADALELRGVGPFTTVAKARPSDLTEAVVTAMQERLHLSRLFIGVETDATQGLETLARHVTREENHCAMELLEAHDLYVCFNLLIFDPDTTLASLERNLAFMERWGHHPFNFGRAELYAGTPLLARLQAAGRCRGDYLGWDYDLQDPLAERVFRLSMRCFQPRNFASDALANRLQGTHFDVVVARHFHPEEYRSAWLGSARALSRRLATDTVAGLRAIIAHVLSEPEPDADPTLVEEVSAGLRSTEKAIAAEAAALEAEIQAVVGRRCQHVRPVPSTLSVGWPSPRVPPPARIPSQRR